MTADNQPWWASLTDGQTVQLTASQCRDLLERDPSRATRRLPPDFPSSAYNNDPRWRRVLELAASMAADPNAIFGEIEISQNGQLGDGYHRTLAASLAGGATFVVRR